MKLFNPPLVLLMAGCASTPDINWAEINLREELNSALARGDRVKKLPRGDYIWEWAKPGEPWDFRRWHYEIVRP